MDSFFKEFTNKAKFSTIFDGEQIALLMKFYDQPIYNEESGLFRLYWGFEADPLPVGVHISESTVTFSEPLQLPEGQGGILIGPGTDFENLTSQCTLIVGAPDASWQVVAESDFSEEKGLFENSQTETDYL